MSGILEVLGVGLGAILAVIVVVLAVMFLIVPTFKGIGWLFKQVFTPMRCSKAALYGMASFTSILYAHQSLKVLAVAPCALSSRASLYPSSTWVKMRTRKPMLSATCISMAISLCT